MVDGGGRLDGRISHENIAIGVGSLFGSGSCVARNFGSAGRRRSSRSRLVVDLRGNSFLNLGVGHFGGCQALGLGCTRLDLCEGYCWRRN